MKNIDVLGVQINCFNRNQLIQSVEDALISNTKIKIATINNEIANYAHTHSDYRKIINEFDIKLADSVGVATAARLLGREKIERIQGANFVFDLCRIAQKNNKSIYFLGGRSGVGEKSRDELKKIYPDLKIAGWYDGAIISQEKNPEITKLINGSGAEIVFVCLGAPKQEKWIANNIADVGANIFIGLGGTLDFISKTLPRAPKVAQSLGLEWLYRLVIEPRRYKRIFSAVIIFPFRVVGQGVKRLTFSRK